MIVRAATAADLPFLEERAGFVRVADDGGASTMLLELRRS